MTIEIVLFLSASIDVISIWLLFILIWFCVVLKWWWDLVNCMVWIFLLYDGLNQICNLSVYHLMVKEKWQCWVLVVRLTRVLGVKLLGSSKFRCLAVFNGWLLKLFYFFQYWCDFDLIVVHSYLILCCVKMMMGSGELYGLDIFTVWRFKSDGWLQGNRRSKDSMNHFIGSINIRYIWQKLHSHAYTCATVCSFVHLSALLIT
jgi:hypothetical protein